ncbi:hypothetical protein IFM46972_11366 [Aspergillus udagawae]|uniref:Uncharacterized protein n=1 Tax=Aspergillus udagawae TaxID=91492 RepID=A0A8H3SH23_9EURO|nr:hypothetical protein IFM46972_11366 [Aspergillus udagawae]
MPALRNYVQRAMAAGGIPDLDSPIIRGRGDQLGIIREGHRFDRASIALELLQAMAAGGIPDLDSPIS